MSSLMPSSPKVAKKRAARCVNVTPSATRSRDTRMACEPLASRSRAAIIASIRPLVTLARENRRDGATEVHPGTPSHERRTTVNPEHISRSWMRSRWSRRRMA
jgi:hypothetical protein